RWLNRILALPIGMQNAIFEEFLGLVEARVSAAREAGSLDVGVETLRVEQAEVVEDFVLRTDERTGATSHLLQLALKTRARPIPLERVLERRDYADGCILLHNTKSGKAALAEPSRHFMTEQGELIRRVILHRPLRREYHHFDDLAESAWEEAPHQTFEKLWQTEVEELAERLTTETVYLATGLLLPIWSSLPVDYLEVRRIVDEEGRSWLGRMVHELDVAKLLEKFDIASTVELSPDTIIRALGEHRTITIKQPFEATIKCSRVAGEKRYEIVGAPVDQLPWLKSIGCFTEIIAFRTRAFIPAKKAAAVIGSLLRLVAE
ncbi:strawberry notch C-terminal domain-containing protein, partial [Erythrobacter sp. CCH5-A1]|uniref:strawberry notch C-terminal domain-containing protein n=1 Tax=Erythrobacter sp. CCH5-A1 TaxID=1768792 RepID=UPI000B0B6F6A